ncbi:MAG: histidine phosphatase family protein [Cyclobacteriaceae bacterium]
MVKKLYLVRHATAEETQSGFKDIDRNLNATGLRDANRLGNFLASNQIMPDMVISSDAIRAQQTAQVIAEQIKFTFSKIKVDADIYEASVRTLLRVINEFENGDEVLLVAHNPGITFLAEYLTGENVGNMAPGSLTVIKLQANSWKEISEKTGSLESIRHPD